MRVLLISDSHIPQRARDLPAAVWDAAHRADAILHAGDLTDLWVYHALRRFAPTYAVQGNVDPPETASALPGRRLVTLGGLAIGLTHGHLGRGRTTPERALSVFAADPVRVVVFGHSHEPLVERRDGVLLVNPGSVTDRRRAPHCSFAWLTIRDREPQVELVPIQEGVGRDAGGASGGPL